MVFGQQEKHAKKHLYNNLSVTRAASFTLLYFECLIWELPITSKK